MITLGALNDLRGIRHAFFTRRGGVSNGHYESLNCGTGSGDDPNLVRENRRRVLAMLSAPGSSLVTVHQCHSADCVTVERPFQPDTEPPQADAMVTTQSGLALGILTADCVPVLMASRCGQVIGAVHAGWKGAYQGVLERTVDTVADLGVRRSDIIAGVGPCIGHRSYEVGPEFRDRFLDDSGRNDDFFCPAIDGSDRFLFDLPGYVCRRLAFAGIEHISRCPHDTLAEEARFFSYRRGVQRGDSDYGRQISVIVRC